MDAPDQYRTTYDSKTKIVVFYSLTVCHQIYLTRCLNIWKLSPQIRGLYTIKSKAAISLTFDSHHKAIIAALFFIPHHCLIRGHFWLFSLLQVMKISWPATSTRGANEAVSSHCSTRSKTLYYPRGQRLTSSQCCTFFVLLYLSNVALVFTKQVCSVPKKNEWAY